jgi:hypothetical protein
MQKIIWLGVLSLILSPGWSHADQVRVPVGQQSQASVIERPLAGMKKQDVEQKFGAPLERQGPVGEPPISRWEYRDFTVYFEYNTVLLPASKAEPDKGENSPSGSLQEPEVSAG